VLPKLTATEARIIGCLLEKSILTPDVYPLTLNALTNACNQKSSREPVTSLSQGEVQHTARGLKAKHLLSIEENFKSGVEKYTQRFCNGRSDDLQLDSAQFAIICLLLLRGAQTPGELRAHSGRLHSFADNEAVVATLAGLIERDGPPLVVKLPRTPGRKDSEYMHLFFGDIDIERYVTQTSERPEKIRTPGLEERVSRLEAELAEIREILQKST